ncbi:MAG: glycosyltransferase family 9 protein [bacterium]|nr:glycosyltransferase family 9 protein [bacterium]
MKIIIPIVAGIGNALLAVPLVRRLKRMLPEGSIHIVALNQAMAEVYSRLDEVDCVSVIRRDVIGVFKMLAAVRRKPADIFLVPFPSNRWQYSLWALLSGAQRKILHSYPCGKMRSLSFLASERIPARQGLHDVEQNLRLLLPLGLNEAELLSGDVAPVFAVGDRDRENARQLLHAAGYQCSGKPIVIHAGSAGTVLAKAKRWPVEKFGKLVQGLEKEWGPCVVIVEGPDEKGVAQEILAYVATSSPVVVSLCGGLGDAAALLEQAQLYVGSDSGLAHLAAAVGTPAVSLFGPADPERVCPYGQRHLAVLPEKRDCAPCNSYPWQTPFPKVGCSKPDCMDAITVESVMVNVMKAVREKKK